MRLEDDLRRALRADDAPEGLEARVLARVASAQARIDSMLTVPPNVRPLRAVRWVALAASLIVAAAGAFYYEQQLGQAEGERAAHEVRQALQIASDKLALVGRRINKTSDSGF